MKAAEAFGCRAIRVFEPNKIAESIAWARRSAEKTSVPVLVEIITERVTNRHRTGIDKITEFEPIVDLPKPTVPEKGLVHS